MKTVQVIEEVHNSGTEWVVSLTDSNPEVKDCFVATSRTESFRIKSMLEKWANEDRDHSQDGWIDDLNKTLTIIASELLSFDHSNDYEKGELYIIELVQKKLDQPLPTAPKPKEP